MAHVEENGIALDRLTAQQIEDGILRTVPGGEIDAALRNKVNKAGELIVLGTDVLSLAPGRYLIDGLTIQANDMHLPVPAWHYEIVVYASENKIGLAQNYKAIKVYPSNTGAEYTNQMNYDGNWTGWVKTATATPPQEHDLPLAAGVTGTVRYSKDQFGTVRLSGLISFPSDTTEISIFGTLPNGFRPQNGQYISSCGWLEGGANVVPLMLAVNADGTVAANMFAASTKHVVVQAVFLAA